MGQDACRIEIQIGTDLGRTRAPVAPFVVLVAIVVAAALAMYAHQNRLQSLFGVPPPTAESTR
jgi:hypothetical protein